MSRRWAWLALCLLPLLAPPGRAQEPQADRIRLVSMWNDEYLFLAAQIQDLNVVGRYSRVNQPVWDDDDLELFLHALPPGAAKYDAGAWMIAMSAAEGVSFRRGDAVATPLVTGPTRFRQAVKVHGTLNDNRDADLGWSLEVAVPWAMLGRPAPRRGEVLAFNLVRHLRGETDAQFSLVPGADPRQPSTWGNLVIRGVDVGAATAAGIEPGDASRLLSLRTNQRPYFDGVLAANEWPLLYAVDIQLAEDRLTRIPPASYLVPPAVQRPLPAGWDYELRAVPPRAEPPAYTGERLILAPYRLDYQGNPRHPTSAPRVVRDATGASALSNQPREGLGPWLSGLQASWHRPQLRAAAGAGIDVALVAFEGDRASQQAYSLAALRSLVLAASELVEQQLTCPLLAPQLTLESLRAEAGEDADLTQQVTQESLYRMIRDFYREVPRQLQARVPQEGGTACVVSLGRPPREMLLDASFLAFCEMRFREDFGAGLVWLGSATWARRGVTLDGYASLEAGLAELGSTRGRINVASVGPGYDNAQVAEQPLIRSREATQTLRQDFRQALGLTPAGEDPPGGRRPMQWLLYSTWNDYVNGDNLAASREFGGTYERLAHILSLQFDAPQEGGWVGKLRRVELPRQVISGQTAEALVGVVNAGLRNWTGPDEVFVSSWWYPLQPRPVLDPRGQPLKDKDGKVVLDRRPVAEGKTASHTFVADQRQDRVVPVPIAAVDDAGAPLPPGRYRLRFDLAAGDKVVTRSVRNALGQRVDAEGHALSEDNELLDAQGRPIRGEKRQPVTEQVTARGWFSLRGDSTFDLLVDVLPEDTAREPGATVLEASLPPRVETGQRYPVRLRVRNDSPGKLSARNAVAVRYTVVTRGAHGHAEPAPRPVAPWLAVGHLGGENRDREVLPGAIGEVRVLVPVVADGRPLPPLTDPSQRYQVEFAILDDAGRLLPASAPYAQGLEVLARDWGAAVQSIRVPQPMQAGKSNDVVLTVINTAFVPWQPAATQVGYHWYYWDGVELKFDAGRVPLPPDPVTGQADLKSGERREVKVPVMAPPTVGPYVLVFDVVFNGNVWNSLQPSTSSFELDPQPVVVVGGPVVPLTLDRLFNVKGLSYDTNRDQADFDGRGHSLPAEELPPGTDDLATRLYPSGYLGPIAGVPDWQRSISFQYPDRQSSKANAVRPEGQTLSLQPGRFARLHVLAAATDGDVPLNLAVGTPAGAVNLAPVTVPSWRRAPRGAELLGFMVQHSHNPGADEPTKAYLHHLVLPLNPQAELRSLTLPDQPKLRIVAITLERAPEPEPVLGPVPPAG